MLSEYGCVSIHCKTKPLGKELVGTEEKEYWEKIGETFLGKNKMLNLGYSCMCTLFMS